MFFGEGFCHGDRTFVDTLGRWMDRIFFLGYNKAVWCDAFTAGLGWGVLMQGGHFCLWSELSCVEGLGGGGARTDGDPACSQLSAY